MSHKPLKLFVDSMEDIFTKRRKEMATAVIEALAYAVPKGMESVDFAEVTVNNEDEAPTNFTLSMSTKDFESILEKNIQVLEESESYEECERAMRIKKELMNL